MKRGSTLLPSTYVRTDENERIIETVLSGSDLGVVAGAGTGKTSSAIDCAEEIGAADHRSRVAYIAFNASVAAEARIRFPKNVVSRTAHSFAWADIGRHYEDRLQTSPWALADDIQRFLASDLGSGPSAKAVVYAIIDAVAAFAASADDVLTMKHVSTANQATLLNPDWVVELSRTVWNEMKSRTGKLPMTHDGYLKLWQLGHPQLPFEHLFMDEAQDASPAMLDVFLRQRGQKIMIGDPAQSIYAFRGAVDAFALADMPRLTLRLSHRFGQEIADYANDVLAAKRHNFVLVGRADRASSVVSGGGGVPNAVLTRTNFGMLEAVQSHVESGHSVSFVGGFDKMANRVTAAYEMFKGKQTRHPELRFFRSWDDLVSAAETDQGKGLAPLVRIIAEFGDETPGILKGIQARTAAEGRADITFATVHTFKGKDAESVALGTDFIPFCSYDDKLDEYSLDHDEANIAYVAMTRAKQLLDLGAFSRILRESLAVAAEMRELQYSREAETPGPLAVA